MSDTLRTTSEHEPARSRYETREWQFSNITTVLYKRRWVAGITFLIGAAAVSAYALSVIPVYQAHAQLLLEEKPSIVTFQGVGVTPTEQKGYLETQQRVLQSRSLARRVIDQLNLWSSSDFKSTESPGVRAVEYVKRQAGFAPAPAKVEGTEKTSETIVIDRMLSRLTVVPIRDTRILEVRYESPDPNLAARVVNTLTNTYITHTQETQSHASKEANTWLTDQLAEQRRKVEFSELSLQKYREKENSLSLDAGQNIVVQRLTALNSSVTQAKTDRIAIESQYRRLAASQIDPAALDTFPQVRANPIVQEIRSRMANLQRERTQLASSLGAKHPDMVRLDGAIGVAEKELASEVAKAVDAVHQEYLAALSREKELTAALEIQKGSALALNRQGIEYGVLLREVESNRQIYQSLLQRANEAAVSSNMQGNSVQIVDPAEAPRSPVRPNRRSNLLIGLLVSAIVALGMALGFEAFDSRIQTPADVRDSLQLPFLGMLPYVSRRTLKGKTLVLSGRVPAPYAEACRAIRTNLLASAGPSGQQSLLVTSAAPGDGKSVCAVNLAVALGRSGKRVLIIDADLRRPTVHNLLECPQRPGLAEVLTGVRKPSEAIAATRSPGLWLLPSGGGLSNPSEQLGSKRFKDFLEKLTESFDWVIIDSPPVMAVTDPAVIARLATGVLFVVNAQRTQQKVAQAAVDRLESAGASFAGVVLNSVTLDRENYYNTGYYLPFYGEYVDKRSA